MPSREEDDELLDFGSKIMKFLIAFWLVATFIALLSIGLMAWAILYFVSKLC